ncbi:hypothetical protein B0A49_10085 [Cryomyces minteri]|uniref:AB hydrolase-1 domain-containing protein n=1 Tax=Cryomyces minteri TaxID=331657 RepID=A0A4U0WNF1_9PEZI|nr:hypothetical protein B0A49_10085 [Cryomyces minteri]
MAGRKDVEFPTADGLKLRGWLYSAGEKRPCIILTQGLSGKKEHFLDVFAERFQAAGYAALAYDNRNWGASDGSPRNESDPLLQTRDYSAAFDYAASLPDVDPTKIVFWGSSLAGGNAICAAAVDKRVKAVISQVPFTSGEFVSMAIGPLAGHILADHPQAVNGGSPTMWPVIPESADELQNGTSKAILNTPDVIPFLEALDHKGATTEKSVTLQSLFYMMSHEPKAFIHRISPTPLLMVVGENDLCVPTNLQLAMYQLAAEPKQVHVVRGTGHFGVYYGDKFEENIKVQVDFLNRML